MVWLEKIAALFTIGSVDLDVAANRTHLRSGDEQRIRMGLRFLAEIGPAALDARPDIERFLEHDQAEIVDLARRALAALDG